MLLGFGLVLSEIGALYFKWCALHSWGKYSPLAHPVSEDGCRKGPYGFLLGPASGPHAQLLL